MLRPISKVNKSDIVIAATSDIHGFLDGLLEEIESAKPDVLVIAGDIHPCIMDINAPQWFANKFFPFVESLGIPVVATPGNHDFFLNDFLTLLKGKKLPKNLYFLCDESVDLCGLRFYGSPWVPWINGYWCWEASNATLENRFAAIPNDIDVLITHSPPFVAHEYVDISLDNPKQSWRHFGSKELTNAIRDKKPRICICGHIHSGKHGGVDVKDEKGEVVSRCYNVSRVNERYMVSYPMEIVRLRLANIEPKLNTGI